MADETTKTDASTDVETPPVTDLRELPDEAASLDLSGIGGEPAEEAAPVETPPEPTEEPKEAPAEADTAKPAAVAEEGQTGAAPEPFDPAAWAEAQGIPKHLVASCETPLEAAEAVARRLRHREALDGRKDQELLRLRAQRAETSTPPEGEPDTAEARTEKQVMAEWTSEQREQFREWEEREPEKAHAYMVQQQLIPIIATLREENRVATEQLQKRIEAVQAAPREQELNKEYEDFVSAHPEDYDVFVQEEMPILAAAFGIPAHAADGRPTDVGSALGAKLEDLYALNQLRKTSPKFYGQVVRYMRSGIEFRLARRVAEVEMAEVRASGARNRAEDQVRTAKGGAAAAAGAGVVTIPDEPVSDLRNLPDDFVREI